MAVQEAMAYGLLVIGSPLGVLPHVAVRPATDDPDALAKQIWELFSQPEELQSLGLEARNAILSGYDLIGSAKRFEKLYHSMRASIAWR